MSDQEVDEEEWNLLRVGVYSLSVLLILAYAVWWFLLKDPFPLQDDKRKIEGEVESYDYAKGWGTLRVTNDPNGFSLTPDPELEMVPIARGDSIFKRPFADSFTVKRKDGSILRFKIWRRSR